MLLAVHLLFTALFLLLGVVFACGKGAWLIAGYNTASAAERAKYDEKQLCHAMAKLMFALAGCWLVVAGSEIWHRVALLWIGPGLFLTVIVLGVIYMNVSPRLKK